MNKLALLSLLSIIPILANCSVTSASRVGIDGTESKFYQGAIGGKGGAIRGQAGTPDYLITGYDNEKSFRDGVIGLVTYGLGTIVGSAVEAGQAAKTAQHAATTSAGVANAKTAANVTNTATTAGLIKDVGVKGEVGIGTVLLPVSP